LHIRLGYTSAIALFGLLQSHSLSDRHLTRQKLGHDADKIRLVSVGYASFTARFDKDLYRPMGWSAGSTIKM